MPVPGTCPMTDAGSLATARALLLRASAYAIDPLGWRLELAYGLREATRSLVVLAAEIDRPWSPDEAHVRLFLDTGWDDPARQAHFIRYQTDGSNAQDPFRAALFEIRDDVTLGSIETLVGAAYRECDAWLNYMKPGRIGDIATCIVAIGTESEDRAHLLTCIRDGDQPPFSEDDLTLLGALGDELRVPGRIAFADSRHPVAALTPRRRTALEAVLSGLSEAEAAGHLGISTHTFHSHVRDLYEHFAVRSRAELQAMFYGQGRLYPNAFRGFDHRHTRIRRSGAPMARPWRDER